MLITTITCSCCSGGKTDGCGLGWCIEAATGDGVCVAVGCIAVLSHHVLVGHTTTTHHDTHIAIRYGRHKARIGSAQGGGVRNEWVGVLHIVLYLLNSAVMMKMMMMMKAMVSLSFIVVLDRRMKEDADISVLCIVHGFTERCRQIDAI